MLVEDHSFFRNSLFKLINSQADMQVCAQTGTGEEALSLCQLHRPDLVLLDICLPGENGLTVLEKLKVEFPQLKVVALTMNDDKTYYSEVMKLGGSGLITKKTADYELLPTIRSLFAC
jgi:two-component system response regulator DegU